MYKNWDMSPRNYIEFKKIISKSLFLEFYLYNTLEINKLQRWKTD